jgi:hypothetical protein
MKKSFIKWIDRCIIESPIYIALCTSKKDFKKEMKRLKVDNPLEWIPDDKDGKVHHILTNPQGKKIAIVCIRKHKDRIEMDGLLIHEAVHVWQEIKADLNEQNPSPEFEAYSIQMIAQRLIEKLRGK